MEAEEFKAVFLPLARVMYVEALRILRSQADAEDAVQEVYTRLWEHRRELGLVDNPRSYSMTVLRNHCLHIVTAAMYRRTETTGPFEGTSTFASSDPHEEIESRDRIGKVFELLETLPENQRKVLTMHDVEGRTNQEIGQITGLSPDNIRKLLSRARKAIRSHFS